jgi:hypothetical protein
MLQSYNAEINGTQLKWIDAPPAMAPHQRVVVTFPSAASRAIHKLAAKYDFSDLLGRLKWNGDAVAEQRSLRNEW